MRRLNICIVGGGNVATHLALNLAKYHTITEVYSRTESSAKALAEKVGCGYTTDIHSVDKNADVYIFSVKDSALEELLSKTDLYGKTLVHTAGSMPLDVLSPASDKFGVIYPLQSISKEKSLDFKKVPLFVEANDLQTKELLLSISRSISDVVYEADSTFRGKIHLAAVFACNFSNHLYTIASDLLKAGGIPFDVLLPLIDETTNKIHTIEPARAQTGPAVRYDKNVIDKHIAMLTDPRLKQIYELLTESIHDHKG